MAEAERIDGKAVSAKLRADLRRETEEFTRKTGIVPGLAVVLVGNNPASEVYVRNKKKAALECGFYSEEHDLPADTTKEQLDDLILRLNRDPKIHGILFSSRFLRDWMSGMSSSASIRPRTWTHSTPIMRVRS